MSDTIKMSAELKWDSQMTKEEIYQRMIDCRLIADEVYAATVLLPNTKESFEVSWCAEKVLDEIDYFLNCLRNMGVVAE